MFNEEKISALITSFLEWGAKTAGNILIAIVFLIVGFRLLKVLIKFLRKSFKKSNMEPGVASFIVSFSNISIKIILLISAAGIAGLQVTSFLTILGSAGIAVGLALQGGLSNLAGGVLILLLKPFQVGDYIIEDNKGNEGTVVSVDIFYTKLKTIDNKIIVIPNGILSNTSLKNVTKQDERRIDLNIGIEYNESITKAREVLLQVINSNENILQEESVDIFVSNFDPSSINMGVRVWVKTEKYWKTRSELLENIKNKFDENNISIPFDHLDVNIINPQ